MVAGVIPIMAGVILITAGVIPITDGAILITAMDPTGQDLTADTGMVIIMVADTIIPHLITLIMRVDGDTATDFVNLGQVIQNMVPGA